MSQTSLPTWNVPSQAVAAARPNAGRQATVVAFVLTLFVAALACLSANGQEPAKKGYDVIKLHQAYDLEENQKKMKTQARAFAGVGQSNPVLAKMYFETFVPAKMTDPKMLGEMGDMVGNASALLSRAQRSKNPKAPQILRWMFDGMSKVAQGNYHPPARVNALLVLGRLDAAAADQVAQTPPRPLPNTFPILMKAYEDENNPDGVRAAALQGIRRHALLRNLPAADKTKVETEMKALLAAEPPAGRSPEAHAYLQRFAVDILNMTRAPEDPSLGTQLVSISTESDKPALIALYSVAKLGTMGETMKGQVKNTDQVLDAWSGRIVEAFQSEVARLEALKRIPKAKLQPPTPGEFLRNKREPEKKGPSMMGGPENAEAMMMAMMGGDGEMMEGPSDADYMEQENMMMMMMMGGEGPGGIGTITNPQPPEVIASRRKLNHVIQQIHLGVTGKPTSGMPSTPGGMLAMVDDADKAKIEAWVDKTAVLLETLNDPALDKRETYLEALVAEIEALGGSVDKANKKAADAAADDELRDLLGGGEEPAAAAKAVAAPAPPAEDELGL